MKSILDSKQHSLKVTLQKFQSKSFTIYNSHICVGFYSFIGNFTKCDGMVETLEKF